MQRDAAGRTIKVETNVKPEHSDDNVAIVEHQVRKRCRG